jgi:hypothetical protein
MEIRLRNRVFPRRLSNLVAFWFLFLVIPIIYWFEIFVVLPTIHDPWSFGYLFHSIAGTFLMINITSNLLAAVVVDPSIQGRFLEAPNPPGRYYTHTTAFLILRNCLFSAFYEIISQSIFYSYFQMAYVLSLRGLCAA